MKRSRYFLQFLKDPKVAALGPTSKRVGKEVCKGIPSQKALNVLELGPGDGAVTSRLLSRLSDESRILAIETNPQFCEELRAWDDPRMTVVQDRAENFRERMKENGSREFDLIISGIPCSMLSHEAREKLVEELASSVCEGGYVILYQLSPLMRKYLRKVLELEPMKVRMNGLFPMFIMKGRRPYSRDPVEREKGPNDLR